MEPGDLPLRSTRVAADVIRAPCGARGGHGTGHKPPPLSATSQGPHGPLATPFVVRNQPLVEGDDEGVGRPPLPRAPSPHSWRAARGISSKARGSAKPPTATSEPRTAQPQDARCRPRASAAPHPTREPWGCGSDTVCGDRTHWASRPRSLRAEAEARSSNQPSDKTKSSCYATTQLLALSGNGGSADNG